MTMAAGSMPAMASNIHTPRGSWHTVTAMHSEAKIHYLGTTNPLRGPANPYAAIPRAARAANTFHATQTTSLATPVTPTAGTTVMQAAGPQISSASSFLQDRLISGLISTTPWGQIPTTSCLACPYRSAY